MEPRFTTHVEIEPGLFLERPGWFFEDLEPGDTIEHRPGKTFTAEETARQTLRSLDHLPQYSDQHYRVARGPVRLEVNPLHLLAVLTGMMTKTISRIVANLAWKEVRFHQPIFAGETVYAETTILGRRESRSRPGQGVVHTRTQAFTHDGRLACTFERMILVWRRGHGPYAAAGY